TTTCSYLCLDFFFQAEDGIRDFHVTGVQTCALPISVDQLRKVVDNLSRGIDDRGEIITFYNPGEFHLGCLRPCMHTHNFSLLGDTLHLTSYQRSCDVPLGLNFNQVQVFVFLALRSEEHTSELQSRENLVCR